MRQFIAHLLILSVIVTNVAWAMDDCYSLYSNNEISGEPLLSDLSNDSQSIDICDELCVGWLHLVAIPPATKFDNFSFAH